ncbi:MAG: hypothetical protein JW814_01790 [Candidatus Krumholzibacteriota bacterium]|nr:hypothetical protein [Candidatus Krumholzibacteriota bacterium]
MKHIKWKERFVKHNLFPVLSFILFGFVSLINSGCQSYDGNLPNSDISKEVEMMKRVLRYDSSSVIIRDTLNIEGYFKAYTAENNQEYTVLALAEPEYYEGYYSVNTYTLPSGGTYTTTTKANASISFNKTDVLFAFKGTLPKSKQVYVFSANLSGDVIDYKGNKLLVVHMTKKRSALDSGDDLLKGTIPEIDTALFKKKQNILEGFLDNSIDEDLRIKKSQYAINPPVLPGHLYDLDGKVFFLCRTYYPLDNYMAPTPTGFRLETEWKSTAKAYENIMNEGEEKKYDISERDAERMYHFSMASYHLSRAEEYLLGEKRILHIGTDRENAVQKERDERASKHINKAIAIDSLWKEPYLLEADNLVANGKSEKADQIIDIALKRGVADSAVVKSYISLKNDGKTWLTGTFRWQRKLEKEPVRMGRNWRLGANSDIVIGDYSSFSIGVLGSYNLTKETSLDLIWSPISYGFDDLVKGPGITFEESGDIRPDRYSLEVRYQIPIRLQFWKYGWRLHAVTGAVHYSRYESFSMYDGMETTTYETEIDGWLIKMGIGITSREFYTRNDKRYHRFEVGYIFGKSVDLEAVANGETLPLLSGDGINPIQHDPKGFYMAYYFLF